MYLVLNVSFLHCMLKIYALFVVCISFVQSNYASFCLLCALLVEEFFWSTKIKGGIFMENPNKIWKGKCLGLGVWVRL